MPPLTNIALVNRSTVLSDADIQAIIPALQAQVTEDWLPYWPGRGAMVSFVELAAPVPPVVWPLYILDHTDVPGDGGYHDDMGGLTQGKVFVGDALEFDDPWTIDVSHELLEMLGDPTADTIIQLPHGLRCLQEVCDPVSANQYAYTKSQWPGVLLSDFVLPHYFLWEGQGPYDFTYEAHGPAPCLLPGGYLGIELPNGQWTQIVERQEDGLISRRAMRSGRTYRRIG